MISRIVFFVAMVMCGSAVVAKECTRLDVSEAEAVLDYVDSWKTMHLAHEQYRHCETNLSISEGFSSAVAGLLLNDWQRLPDLVQVLRRDPVFEDFVLGHIDETIEDGDRHSLDALAKGHCPTDAAALCGNIRNRLSSLGPWHSGNAT